MPCLQHAGALFCNSFGLQTSRVQTMSFAAALRPFLLVLASDQSSCAVSQRWGRHVHVRAAPRAQEAVYNTSATNHDNEAVYNTSATNHDNEAIARATREQRQAGAGLLTNIAGVLLTIVALGSAVAVLLELVLPSRAAIKWLYSRWTGPSQQLRAKATTKKTAARQRRRQVGAGAEAERVAAQVEAHRARADAAQAAAAAATAAARARVEAARAEVEAARAEVEAAMADAMRRSATLIAERDAERGAAPTETASDSPCVVCCDVEATHILAPCGHRAVCTGCARLIKECPLCRAPVLCVVGKVYAVN